MLRSPRRRPFAFFAHRFIVVSFGLLFAQPTPSQTSSQIAPSTRKGPPPHHLPPAPVSQQQFISYWTTETGWQTQLELRNNQAAGVLAITPVLRAEDGRETVLATVTIQPQDVQTLDVESAIGTSAPQLIGAYGSVVLRYSASSFSALYAVAVVHGLGHSVAFHLDGIGEDEAQATGGREGIWWLPNATAKDYLVLANHGTSALPLKLTLFDASGKSSAQNLTLSPAAMNRLSVSQLLKSTGLSGSYGGIQLSAASHAGSLNTLHVVFDESVGFSAMLKMFDYDPLAKLSERDYAATGTWTLRAPMLALSNPDPALAFPFGTKLRPQLLVRNTTVKPIDASLRFTWHRGTATGKAAGPQLRLLPYETRLIDVAALEDGTILPQDANWAAVTLTSNALPDELMAVAVSYDQELKYGAQTPFSDQLAFHWAGSQWQYDPHHDSVITVGNGGTKATTAAFTIFYNQGSQKYELEQALQPDEQMWIDVGKLIREHIADKNGKTLPADLTTGSYDIRDLTNKAIGTLFEGKLMYDTTYGHVTYGCGVCCAFKPPVLAWDPLGILFQGTSPNGVDAYDTCSNSEEDVSGAFDGHWTTLNSAIATVDTYGTHTGQGIGSTSSSTWASMQQWRPHSFVCPIQNYTPSGADKVTPKILLGGSSGTNITDTTQPAVVGEQIVLYGSYTLPSGYTFTSLSWAIPNAWTDATKPQTSVVGGWSVGPNYSNGNPIPVTTITQQKTTFYWVAAASAQTITFTLNYKDTSGTAQIATAQTTFNINGPTSVNVTVPPLGSIQFVNNGTTAAQIEFGDASGTVGIQFNGTGAPPPPLNGTPVPGTFEWSQIILTNSYTYTGTTPPSCNGPTGLDNFFPLPVTGFAINDSPIRSLPAGDTEFTWSWNATMYFLWIPGIAGNQTIPVTLGSVSWNFQADVTQNVSTHTWTVKSGPASNGSFVPTSTYPTWTTVAQNGNMNGCT